MAVIPGAVSAQEIDRLVRSAALRAGCEPAPPADRITWLRRVSLDLTGVPPSLDEAAAFVADDHVDAREHVVDRLLASPRYGERWAQWWLDLARYADSQGYEKDGLRRSMWRYRDWVIAALHRDMPFDQFTIEQLAGDLLPNATVDQRVATAFHRQTMTNTEGGTSDEEFRTAAVIDRVDTTMSVWMGATAGCAQCHDHKYDPISQREFFGLYAFFNQTEDTDRGDDAPTLRAPTVTQQARQKTLEFELAELRQRLSADDAVVAAWAAEQGAAVRAFDDATIELSDWHLLGPVPAATLRDAHTTAHVVERDGVQLNAVQDGLPWVRRPEFTDGTVHTWRGDNSAFYLYRTLHSDQAASAVLSLGSDDAIKAWWNGVEILAKEVSRGAAADQELLPITVQAGDNTLLLKITNGGGVGGFYFRLRAAVFDDELAQLLVMEGKSPNGGVIEPLRAAYGQHAAELAPTRARIAEVEAEFAANLGPQVPVLRELPAAEQRNTHLLLRGSFLAPGEAVEPHTPACWPPMPDDAPRNRLGFARWLMAADNPRTARVLSNRIWAELFGQGLVLTVEDFGKQGEPCSHPELLDWLAAEFVRSGWSLKHLLRTIVLSQTYGQSSVQTPETRELDRYNRWLARGPAFRLTGEMLRDQALAVSGLLAEKVGGPSVMPPQPDGVWAQIYSGAKWVEATGPDRHRRALYTFWRRTSPHPAMMLMDAQSREFCVLRRQRTNTPLQALVLWNDPQFFEAATALADRALRDVAIVGNAARVDWLWRQCLLRSPTEIETRRLLDLLIAERAAGASDHLAWTVLASVVMNLDEFVTKR